MENHLSMEVPAGRSQLLKWAVLSVAVGLAILTVFSLRSVDRFYVEKEQLLEDAQFLSGKTHWKEKGSSQTSTAGNRIVITNNLGASHSVFQNVVVDTPAFYKIDFDAGVRDVVPAGKEKWARAGVAVIYRDKNGKRTGSSTVVGLVGSKAIQPYSKTLLLWKDLGSVDISFRLYNAGGEFVVANPAMSRLQEFPFYKNMRMGIVVAWCILLLALVYLLFRFGGIWNLLVVMTLGGVAIVGVMMPESTMTILNQWLAGLIPTSFLTESRRILGFVYEGNRFVNPGSEVSKIGHFVVFSLLGFFAGLRWQKIGLLFALTCIAAFAFITEALQTLVYGRTTSFGDLIIDMIGGAIGLVIGVFLLWCYQSLKTLLRESDSARENHSVDTREFR